MSRRLTVGVIGHVDHGKTDLVRALTGMETDRLEEERRRGLSIVLGFAWLEAQGATLDLIDTPGHEAFVRTMVLGATGFNAALLVVAADEGIKPQTREHLAIARIFGLAPRIVVAVSKIDRVPPVEREARLAVLSAQLRVLIGAPAHVIATSVRTGEGLDHLRAHLAALQYPPLERAPKLGFWLPVDRAFNKPGFGLVVTGTLHGTPIRTGDTVEITPGRLRGQVRQVQVHGREVAVAEPGGRVALNLRRIVLSDLPKGAMVASPGLATVADGLDVQLRIDHDVGIRLKTGARVRLLTGGVDVGARARLLDQVVAEPGQCSFVRLQTDQPIAVVPGARFVLRRPSPSVTLGGGIIVDALDAASTPVRRGDHATLARIAALAKDDRMGAARIALAAAGSQGCSEAEITRWVGADAVSVDLDAVRLRNGRWVGRTALDALAARLADQVFERRRANLSGAFPTAPREAIEAAAAALVERGGFRISDGTLYSTDAPTDRMLQSDMEQQFRAAGLVARPLATIVGEDPARKAAVGQLLREGRLVRLRHAQSRQVLLLHACAVADAQARLRATWPNGGSFTVAAVRDALNLTRRDTLPLLEHFDAVGVTLRRGDLRKLREASTILGGD